MRLVFEGRGGVEGDGDLVERGGGDDAFGLDVCVAAEIEVE